MQTNGFWSRSNTMSGIQMVLEQTQYNFMEQMVLEQIQYNFMEPDEAGGGSRHNTISWNQIVLEQTQYNFMDPDGSGADPIQFHGSRWFWSRPNTISWNQVVLEQTQ